MLVFFRKPVLVISPMIVAMVSVIVTMSLLVVTGNTVHIMSSMIPIFIMPIAVLDAVHILSEFFDRYQEAKDRRTTMTNVMNTLFTPMLYTSLTTAVGFGSLVLGPVGKGIGNVEVGYYDSREDRGGDNPFANNSEIRLLVGYEREIARELTMGVQYYLEHMLDYGDYRRALPAGAKRRDRDRHVLTLRLTQLLMSQNLRLSMFAYLSPSDADAYLRPHASYNISDSWTAELGGNVFLGDEPHTFFGQFTRNSNLYAGVRYSF